MYDKIYAAHLSHMVYGKTSFPHYKHCQKRPFYAHYCEKEFFQYNSTYSLNFRKTVFLSTREKKYIELREKISSYLFLKFNRLFFSFISRMIKKKSLTRENVFKITRKKKS